ncbi:MAG: sugar-binding transcriptional regulator [Rothia sp. (in: high G+C Gram-positive bacteria)]|nr:sugar-binding transcriptional regulator [Rothia sp. (in: high G+C Gram-positive bacteria)]
MATELQRIHRSSTSDEREHVQLLLKVARMYYEEGATQAQIAKQVGYSRPTVSRLLTEAREEGVVHIRITHPLERSMSMEEALAHKFGLVGARIAEATDLASLTQNVARCAADYLIETSLEDCTIAVSNGFAVNATIEAMPRMNWYASKVIQAIGSVNNEEVLVDASETCRRLASQLGGRHIALPAPLVVSSPEVAAALAQSTQVATILNSAARADVALVGIGTVADRKQGYIFDGYFEEETSQILAREGAVGHICGHHFDADGRHILTPLCNRTIGITPAHLQRMPKVVGVAWGEHKLDAIRGALKGKLISVLVTNRDTAEALLASD